jgi:acid stress-induced BolA-like protein IbaG/YrbA
VFVLLTPLTPLQMFLAYALAAIARGLLVGTGVLLSTLLLADVPLLHPLWALAFAVLGGAILGVLGIIAGIWADKFDQLAAFQNFLIVPLTFLAGVFYSVHSLPDFWQRASHLNPFSHGGPVSLRLLRRRRCSAAHELGGGRGLPGGAVRADPAAAAHRLQAADLTGVTIRGSRHSEGIAVVLPDDVKTYIQQGLDCEHVEVVGDGQHFEALIVSATFRGKSRVQQHQLVYRALGERMREEIHALSMQTFTPEDWVGRPAQPG